MDPVFVLIAALMLAWLFATAGWSKLRQPYYYLGVFKGYDLRWLPSHRLTIWLVASVELSIALALLLMPTRPIAALAAAGLLFLYAAVIALNIWRGKREIDCGCGGPAARQPLSSGLLARNGLLISLALVAGAEMSARSLGLFDFFMVLWGAALLALFYQAAEQLRANQHQLVRLA